MTAVRPTSYSASVSIHFSKRVEIFLYASMNLSGPSRSALLPQHASKFTPHRIPIDTSKTAIWGYRHPWFHTHDVANLQTHWLITLTLLTRAYSVRPFGSIPDRARMLSNVTPGAASKLARAIVALEWARGAVYKRRVGGVGFIGRPTLHTQSTPTLIVTLATHTQHIYPRWSSRFTAPRCRRARAASGSC